MDYTLKNKDGSDVLGWLSEEEADILYEYALKAPTGKVLELGSFVGRSAIVLASAMRKREGVLTCIDYFADNMLFEALGIKQVVPDTLKAFWNNINERELQNYVTTLKGDYKNILPTMNERFGLIFIDGGHDFKNTSFASNYSWEHLEEGGYLIFHDYNNKVWPDVKICVDNLKIRHARDFVKVSKNSTMVVLKK